MILTPALLILRADNLCDYFYFFKNIIHITEKENKDDPGCCCRHVTLQLRKYSETWRIQRNS